MMAMPNITSYERKPECKVDIGSSIASVFDILYSYIIYCII